MARTTLRTSSTHRAAALALAAALTGSLAGLAGTPASAAPPPVDRVWHVARAELGADWIARQIRVHGGYLEAYGAADANDTAYGVIALNSVGSHRRATGEALRYLRHHLAGLKNADGSDNPAALAYFVLAGLAAGADVHHFGGDRPVNDLPARLLRTVRSSGHDAGLVGRADPTYDGAFRQGVALAALSRTAPQPADSRRVRLALRWLERQQCANGLWAAYRADPRKPCPQVDPSTFAGPDTNSTGMAVQGLAAYGHHPRRVATLARLHQVQSADGGFPYLAAPGQSSDPDSTALTVQAILAEGRSPTAAAWRKHGATPYRALASYQLTRRDPAVRGAFSFPPDRTPNVFATVQAVPAMAGRTLPVVRRSSAASSTRSPRTH